MGCALTDLVPVGTKPAGDGVWGQSDLGGNVWEWVLDWDRVIRGGSFGSAATFLRVSLRSRVTPGIRYDNVGLRSARSAP